MIYYNFTINTQKVRRRRLINSRNVLLPAEFLASLYQETCRFYYIWICNTREMIFGRVLRWYSAITARESTLYCGLSAMRTCRNWIRCTILQEKSAFPEKVRVLYTDLFLLLRTVLVSTITCWTEYRFRWARSSVLPHVDERTIISAPVSYLILLARLASEWQESTLVHDDVRVYMYVCVWNKLIGLLRNSNSSAKIVVTMISLR